MDSPWHDMPMMLSTPLAERRHTIPRTSTPMLAPNRISPKKRVAAHGFHGRDRFIHPAAPYRNRWPRLHRSCRPHFAGFTKWPRADYATSPTVWDIPTSFGPWCHCFRRAFSFQSLVLLTPLCYSSCGIPPVESPGSLRREASDWGSPEFAQDLAPAPIPGLRTREFRD